MAWYQVISDIISYVISDIRCYICLSTAISSDIKWIELLKVIQSWLYDIKWIRITVISYQMIKINMCGIQHNSRFEYHLIKCLIWCSRFEQAGTCSGTDWSYTTNRSTPVYFTASRDICSNLFLSDLEQVCFSCQQLNNTICFTYMVIQRYCVKV